MNILLYSSGVDSYIANYYLTFEKNVTNLIPVYFSLGHRYDEIEKYYCRGKAVTIEGIKFAQLTEQLDAHVPNRNALLVLLAHSYFSKVVSDSFTIYIAGLADDNVSDNNSEFIEKMSDLLSFLNKQKIEVKSAFDYKLTKSDIVEWYIKKFNDIDSLKKETFSCYDPKVRMPITTTDFDYHCYNCKACFRRNVALFPYVKLPFYNKEILQQYRKNINNYHSKRQIKIQEYLEYLESKNLG